MRSVIVDERISEGCRRGLMRRGFTPLFMPRAKAMTDAISAHPDSLLFKHEGHIITTAEYCEESAWFFSDLREMYRAELHFSSESFSSSFPGDAIMNALIIGNKLFCNTKTISKSILNFAKNVNLEVIHTNQAYPKCATLVLDNEHAITADRGLGTTLKDTGIDVTLIGCEGISLPPYKHGFIGGASGVYEGRVYFFGDLSMHPDAEIIEKAVSKVGLISISLSSEPLYDFGGMIFLE